MASIILVCCCCLLLVLTIATGYGPAVEAFHLEEYRVEIYNTLPDNVRAVCYNSWAQTTSEVIYGGSSHNITFDLPFAWCCEFVWNNKRDPRTFFQGFLVSNALGRVSDDPEISCGKRCSWKLDLKGFSVFYNGLYRRMYSWLAEGRGYQDEQPNANVLLDLKVSCNIARLNSNSSSAAFAGSAVL